LRRRAGEEKIGRWFSMPDEQGDVATETAPDGAKATAKEKQSADDRPRRSPGDRAIGSIRAAKRGQREVSEPTERARLLLAEANVLALLDVADALAGGSGNPKAPNVEETESSD
jgi:hypothetical protein